MGMGYTCTFLQVQIVNIHHTHTRRFCNEIGVTRNSNTVQYERLSAVARAVLHERSPRLMAVLRPLEVSMDMDSPCIIHTYTTQYTIHHIHTPYTIHHTLYTIPHR
ncbi:hypothetical protein EON63_00415 [archaeon]|nr:MAG: hypothetical protein EON63_00415 [archaeon]